MAAAASSTAAARTALRAWWLGLAVRERRAVIAAGVVLGVFLIWAVALQPAWRTLRAAPAEHDRLDAQQQSMQRLAAEAAALRATPPVAPAQAAAALQAATDRLGGRGRLTLQGDRAVLTLDGAGTGALRDWLAEARSGARARPVEANLTRGAQGGLSGTLVLALGGPA